eukprot:TRINITY_DN2485_c0_g1_i4.p1 TRINITY_DN2485_c0_g1~~TRINITY_DN2485_c0_g1_i4.p1  ORF type:complete len:197 (-),score=7.84 TRINITY_DN2485_c0_g1_i4:55-645(-)
MHLSLISSISPPKLPVTFYTNVKIVARFNNVTQDPFTGLIANDDAKQLYVYNQKDSHGNPTKALFNKHLYQYLDDPTKCACFNVTYKDLGLPFFNHYKNFVKFAETDSDIIWKCTDTPSDETLLFSVNKKTPNVPEKTMVYFKDGHARTSENVTFTGFQASQPDGELFRIPDDCTKVPCPNPPREQSMFFTKFLGF